MRLAVAPDGSVVVTAPLRILPRDIERFVAQHREWISDKVEKAKKRKIIRIPRGDIARLKREALVLAQSRSEHYARIYGFAFKKVTVRAQKTRWGSCSKNGNLSFNYKIAALPKALAEYIVVHEVCHLGAFDHSKKFWELVARTVPDHVEKRKELRSAVAVFS